MPTTSPRPRPARDRILAAAGDLFYTQGTTSTGIDTVTERAGVARKSLYNNFSSKDDLVAAYLEQRHTTWLGFHAARAAQAADDSDADHADSATRSALAALAVFDAYLDHAAAEGDGFRGCGLLNTAGEYPVDSPVRETVRRHKDEIAQLLADAVPDRAELLSYLLEGAVTRAGLDNSPERLHHARDMAAHILGLPA
ncbi:TetR/AcrR family transcriptional regulator [Corynebacterium nuruki]|uniref:TetR/AcrR family transcriptional regulator n=1 Tax=Corynebacterium nuruki TaxID=1032851 RepID=UPI0039BF7FA6